MQDDAAPPPHPPSLDACWKRIGVFGVKSCLRLAEHVHCRNCEVYSAAAARLLDGCVPDLADEDTAAVPQPQPTGPQLTMLVFRLGDDWLALPTAGVEEVLPMAPVHGLPHGRSRTLLGVAQLHGALVACVSLPRLLGLDDGSPPTAAVRPRLLSLGCTSGAVLAPVDEVDGIHTIAQAAVHAKGTADARVLSQVARGVLQRGNRPITVLDAERFQQALTRNFS